MILAKTFLSRSFYIVLLISGLCCSAKAQDIILDMKGDEIKAKVLEILPTEIKYKKWENIDGPTYVTLKRDVFKITFANGTSELMAPKTSFASSAQPANSGSQPIRNSSGAGSFSAESFYNNPNAAFNQAYRLNQQTNQIDDLERNYCKTDYVPSFGWVPPVFMWEVPRASSGVRIASNSPVVFIAKLREQQISPTKIRLVKFTIIDKKSGSALNVRKLTVLVNASVDNTTSYADNNLGEFDFHSTPDFILPYNIHQLSTGIYEISPRYTLAPGEYAIAVGDYFFCFGVD